MQEYNIKKGNLHQTSISTRNEYDLSSLDGYLKKGIFLLENKSFNEALNLFNEALKYYPYSKELNYNKAIVLAELGFKLDSLTFFDHTIQLEPKDLEPYLEKAKVLMELNKDEDALILYNKTIEINEFSKESYNCKGIVFAKIGNLNLALENFNTAIKIDNSYREAYINKILILTRIYKFEEANVCADILISLHEGMIDGINLKIDILIKLNKYNEALTIIQKFLNNIYNSNGYGLNYNNYNSNLNNPKEQIFEIMLKKAEILKMLKLYEESLKAFDEASKLNQNAKEINFAKALIYSEIKDFDKAISFLDITIQEDPFFKEAYFAKSLIFEELRRFEDALSIIDKILKMDKKYHFINDYISKRKIDSFAMKDINFPENDNKLNDTYTYTQTDANREVNFNYNNNFIFLNTNYNINNTNADNIDHNIEGNFPNNNSKLNIKANNLPRRKTGIEYKMLSTIENLNNKNNGDITFDNLKGNIEIENIYDNFLFEILLEKSGILIQLNQHHEANIYLGVLSEIDPYNKEIYKLKQIVINKINSEANSKALDDTSKTHIKPTIDLNQFKGNFNKNENYLRILYDKALENFKIENFSEALSITEKMCNIEPNNILYLILQSLIYERTQSYLKALGSYERLIQLDSNLLFYHKKIMILFFLKEFDYIIEFINSFPEKEFHIIKFFLKGLILAIQEEKDDAVKNLKKFLQEISKQELSIGDLNIFDFEKIKKIILLLEFSDIEDRKVNFNLEINFEKNDYNQKIENYENLKLNLKKIYEKYFLEVNIKVIDNLLIKDETQFSFFKQENLILWDRHKLSKINTYFTEVEMLVDSIKKNSLKKSRVFGKNNSIQNLNKDLLTRSTDVLITNNNIETITNCSITRSASSINNKRTKNSTSPKENKLQQKNEMKFNYNYDDIQRNNNINKDRENKTNIFILNNSSVNIENNSIRESNSLDYSFYKALINKKIKIDEINYINSLIKEEYTKISKKLSNIFADVPQLGKEEKNLIGYYVKGFNRSFYRCLISCFYIHLNEIDKFLITEENIISIISFFLTIAPYLNSNFEKKRFSISKFFELNNNEKLINRICSLFKNINQACEVIGLLSFNLILDERKLDEIINISKEKIEKIFEKDYDNVFEFLTKIRENLKFSTYFNYQISITSESNNFAFKLGEYDFNFIFRDFIFKKFDILNKKFFMNLKSDEDFSRIKRILAKHADKFKSNSSNKLNTKEATEVKRSCHCCCLF